MNRFCIIKKYIDEYDYYYLLEYGAPSDEFDSYSRKLVERIDENNTVEEIAEIIADVFYKGFGYETPVERYIDIAQKIKDALLKQSFS